VQLRKIKMVMSKLTAERKSLRLEIKSRCPVKNKMDIITIPPMERYSRILNKLLIACMV
jgi:hypothetical protein